MANETTEEGKAGAAAPVVQANAHPETIDTTDALLSRYGAFHAADLRLHGRGHFAGEHPAPDDDRLTMDAAAWRAAAGARNEYAQAQPLGGSHDSTSHMEHNAIGRVDKVVGNVTVVRNGVAVVLHAGDAVFKSDVIQTGSSSSVGIFFSDGTAVHLVANTRMALTAYSYDAGSDANAAAFSLIDGTFGFVAGKLANHGDMKIMTPVATMSVHEGATGWAHELTAGEIASISEKLGSVSYSFAVTDHGDQTHGLFDLIADGDVVGSISDPHLVSYLDRDGNLLSLPLDSSGVTGELAQWLQAGDVVPSALGVHGSGSPIDAPSFPNPISLNSDLLSFSLAAGNGFNSDATGTPIAFFVPGLLTPSFPPGSPSSHIFIWNGVGDWDKNPLDWNQGFAPTLAIDTVIIQTGKANYNNGYAIGSLAVDHGATLNITGGSLAASGISNAGLIELKSSGADPSLVVTGAMTLTGGGAIEMLGPTASNFIVGAAGTGATLTNADNLITGSGNIGKGDGALAFRNDTLGAVDADLRGQMLLVDTGINTVDNAGLFEASVGGTLDIESNLDNSGHVVARAASAILIKADVANESGGTIAADGIFARADISGTAGHPIAIDNDGDVVARHGGRVSFQFSQITNEAANGSEPAGRIIAGRSSRIDVDDSSVDNAGVIAARHGGAIAFDLDQITNQSTGLISARGRGSEIGFDRDAIDNSGIIEAEHRGTVRLDHSLVANDHHGTIDAEGFGATIRLERDVVGNWGTISATLGGLLVADQSSITNMRGGTVEADARDSLVRLDRDDVDNSGRIEAEDRGTVVLGRADVENDRHGVVEADGRGSEVRFDRDHVDNSGRIEADNRGTVVLDRSVVENDRRGAIEADGRASEVRFDHDHVDNCGRIEAERQGEVTFDSSHVDNDGMIGALRGGTVDFDHTHVDNTDGLIAAIGRDSTIDLDHADITGGAIATTWGGLIRTVGGNSDLNDVTIACNSDVLVDKGTTLTLDHGTTMNGGLLTVDGTLHVEPSLAILNGVDVVNHGNILVDPGSAALEVENGAVISGGNLTVGPNGTLDVEGSTLSNVAIFDAGVVNFGAGDTLSPTDVLTFVGTGTVHVEDSGAFDVTLAGLATGDVIDLGDTVVTSAVWNGSSLLLNGASAAFTISGGLPAGDTFGFTSDGHGGTDLEVVVTGTAAVADGGSLEIASPSNQTVTFAGLTGELKLDDPTAFFGHIVGFSATASDSDDIDLVGIDFNSAHFAESYDATTHQLTVSDGTHGASLTLDYFDNVLNFTSDGQGGTLVANQPSTVPSGGSLEISKLSDGTVNFADSTAALKIDNPADFSGHIDGFSATATSSDVIDVSGINFNAPNFTESYNAATHQFTMSDGAQSANFYLDYFSDALNFTGDGHGGTLITNQPAGPMTIAAGERLDVWGLDGDTITFAAGTGELKLDNPAGFWGHIAGFTGTQADAAHSDVIDLVGVDASTATFNYNSSSGLLIVTDGTYHASFTFDNFNGTLKFASDGNGGTLIFDPPKPAGMTAGAAAVAVGDSFRWISEINENSSSVHVDPPHAGTVAGQLPQAVQSFVQGQAQAEWWAEAGHHDVLVNATLDQMQAHLQSAVHLH
jgi:hypothetical protein